MTSALRQARILAWTTAPAALALVTVIGRAAGANAPTIGFVYLVAVLGIAAWGGWAVGSAAAVAATLCFNYFFFPPFGTLIIQEPANWIALLSFLLAATFASRLVTTARRQAEEAQRRRREVEILYELCFGLFAVSHGPGLVGESAALTLRSIGAESGVLLLGAGSLERVSTIGEERLELDDVALDRVRENRRLLEIPAGDGKRTAYIPLDVGGSLNGVLVAQGELASRTVLEPAGRLLALAVERERLLSEAAHHEALRESDRLKTSLLRAVSHDLRTPLTAMRLEIESLDWQLADRPEALASVHGLSLEQARLARRIDNLLSLARLEAGLAKPHPEDVPPSSLFRAAQEGLSLILAGRGVQVRIEPGCPDLWVDPSLALEIVVNLLENAARAAPPELPLELAAAADSAGRVRLEVRDRGPGVPAAIRQLFRDARDLRRPEPGSGDSISGGLGLRIAQSFVEANNGTLALLDRLGGGTVARLDLPAAPQPEEVEE